jgi:NAD+ kinase|tara:strand:+ start:884 stop:1768 length:885 start_codon:yes stop_codon:yes gene_type:complete
MLKVAIYGRFESNFPKEYVSIILEKLSSLNVSIHIELSTLKFIKQISSVDYNSFKSYKDLDSSFAFFISIGGDGTILRSISYVRNSGIPIVGVNTGRMGFLATIQKDKIKSSLDEIVAGDYCISKRSLLKLSSDAKIEGLDKDFNFALNEIAVSRKNTTSMIRVKTFLNNEYLTSYWADGLIVASPTGSTGYSLSCGGPVVAPESDSFVLTPIAPHNLNARPLVIPEETVIKLIVGGREDLHLVSLDSRIITVKNGTELIIQKAGFNINMIEPKGESFLNTLRNKLLWGEDNRN